MCGRYTLHHKPEEIEERFDVDAVEEFLAPRYNIAPSQIIPVIRQTQSREMAGCKWGLIPFWAKDPKIGNNLINAKAETIAEKPSFKRAFAKRRCLIPADGFYEWQKRGKAPSQPMYIRRRDGGLFAFAGLWEEWKSPEGEPIETCTIITVEPNELLSKIHNRMAAILRPGDEAAWIDPKSGVDDLLQMLRPYDSDELEAIPVSRAVNSPAHDSAALIAPIEAE
ncbi:MAG: putative SOS response-associated peptidase YedK [Acidobacteria bacterium]|nr:putative SOS response-associated peptidase YedK [Acidobacteriota bacterium]